MRVAAIQMSMAVDTATNIAVAERLVRDAAAQGAHIVLIPELFEGHYFCKDQRAEELQRARPLDGHPTIAHFAKVARELQVVLPLSLFERANNAYFNTVVVVDADGAVLGKYRKSHIPDGPGYSEKFYFSPGDTGFRVWRTKFGAVGVGICWDQWFPEAARSMALLGADVILYPTAIGSEPQNPTWDSSAHWQRVMQGHAAANLVPVVAANRTGREVGNPTTVTFYGSSFITDATGEKVAEAGRDDERVLVAEIDVEANRAMRAAWGLFRDRRPELYGALTTLDGARTAFDGANETPRR
ncbi:MAG: N-carbamoylputrescine amidase [Actinobacteria bacterium]|nr:N-carbamoylputrescine amidase [Acidimicrobiia bacterium]NCZ86578.1 N-carbamoylputrescine amidase [Actinomycetota bacterium]NDF82284.1 N-carbamoylputrescine amidase [Actinomycetota bacterium]NDH45028.1 N-carbamoylputrescine amidase [Actinomycetota bacterium]